MENNKMKLSINPKLIILICIVLLIILVLIMLLGGNKEKEQQPTQPPAPTKIEITNELMNQLDQKINLLKYNNYCEIGNSENYFMYDCLYRQELTTIDDLSETYRLYTLVLAKDKNMESKINYVVGNIVVDNYKFRYTQQFSIEEFNKEYEALYGDSSNLNYILVNQVPNFPYVKYDSESNKIFYQTTGEKIEVSANEVIEYINDYETDETSAYVYVSTAFITPTGQGNYGIYADYNKTVLIESVPSVGLDKEQIITKENYNKFNTYKYTFTKNESGNLVFKQVELIK